MSELQDTFAEVMQAARNLGKIDSGLEHEMTIYRDTYYGLLDRLQEAHDRELSEARNPSHACMCHGRHEHLSELERMREYERGYRDGLHQRDTDMWQLERERAVATRRLLELTFDALDSHHNLAAIANAVWGAAPVAWSQESCHALALRLAWMLGGDGTADTTKSDDIRLDKDLPICEISPKPTIGDAETESNLWDSPKTISVTELTTERDELRDRLNELDQSGATNLYKLLKHTLGEAKQIADSLRASQHTRKSLMEDVHEKSKEVESLRVECMMYRTVLNDAVEEYTDVAADRDMYMDACKDERPDSYDAIARDLINGNCTRCEGVQRMEQLHG